MTILSDKDTTWRAELLQARDAAHDDSPIVAIAPDGDVLDVAFDAEFGRFGRAGGPHVTIWTEQRVYFPVLHDGAEWLSSAPRNPNGEAMKHV